MSAERGRLTPEGFGVGYWSRQVLDATHLSSDGAASSIGRVLQRLINQTRRDEALMALRILGEAGDMVEAVERVQAREGDHRRELQRDLRRAKRGAK